MKRWLLFALVIVMLGSCGLGTRMPKREPVSATSPDQQLRVTIDSSTNCVAVGETLMLTLRMTNLQSTPIMIDASSDLIIESNMRTQVLVDRWSASADYPQSFDPVLPAGATREYVWNWTARSDFSVQSGATILHTTKQNPSGTIRLYVGVGWYTDGEYVVQCHEMR